MPPVGCVGRYTELTPAITTAYTVHSLFVLHLAEAKNESQLSREGLDIQIYSHTSRCGSPPTLNRVVDEEDRKEAKAGRKRETIYKKTANKKFNSFFRFLFYYY